MKSTAPNLLRAFWKRPGGEDFQVCRIAGFQTRRRPMFPIPADSKSELLLLAAALLVLCGCSSTSSIPSDSTPAAQTVAPPPAAAPPSAATELIEVGTQVKSATGVVTVQDIQPQDRTMTLKRADGNTAVYKAGPEIKRFDQIKVGDEIMSTLTENLTFFVLKGQMTPSAIAEQAVVRTPQGASVGGLIVTAINMNTKVLDVDLENRRVILQYGTNQASGLTIKPGLDLRKVAINDTILIRGTQSLSVMVADR